eukprot:scaffold69_cov248-Pinguiococcus_pyrenoidosus.AAC.40
MAYFSTKTPSFGAADHGKIGTNMYHVINNVTLFVTPLAFILPQGYTMPIDLALNVLFPIHGHIGLNYVVTDYLPKIFPASFFPAARIAVAGLTGITFLGLLKLNLMGPGLTATLKSLWKKPKEESENEAFGIGFGVGFGFGFGFDFALLVACALALILVLSPPPPALRFRVACCRRRILRNEKVSEATVCVIAEPKGQVHAQSIAIHLAKRPQLQRPLFRALLDANGALAAFRGEKIRTFCFGGYAMQEVEEKRDAMHANILAKRQIFRRPELGTGSSVPIGSFAMVLRLWCGGVPRDIGGPQPLRADELRLRKSHLYKLRFGPRLHTCVDPDSHPRG